MLIVPSPHWAPPFRRARLTPPQLLVTMSRYRCKVAVKRPFLYFLLKNTDSQALPVQISCWSAVVVILSDTRITEPAVSHERCRSSGSFIIQSLESFEGAGRAADFFHALKQLRWWGLSLKHQRKSAILRYTCKLQSKINGNHFNQFIYWVSAGFLATFCFIHWIYSFYFIIFIIIRVWINLQFIYFCLSFTNNFVVFSFVTKPIALENKIVKEKYKNM